ncbi:DUF732 domain-containing protein [Rhodococcus sp. NPDC003994]
MRRPLLTLAALAAAFALAACGNGDSDAFLEETEDLLPLVGWSAFERLELGLAFCDRLDAGETPEEILADKPNLWATTDAANAVMVMARAHLCPESG